MLGPFIDQHQGGKQTRLLYSGRELIRLHMRSRQEQEAQGVTQAGGFIGFRLIASHRTSSRSPEKTAMNSSMYSFHPSGSGTGTPSLNAPLFSAKSISDSIVTGTGPS